jgi:hypothetical protein
MMFMKQQSFAILFWCLAGPRTTVLASSTSSTPRQSTSCDVSEDGCITKSTLDAFAQLVGPLNEYNMADWNSLRTCLEENITPEINMVQFSDAAWAGFLRYGETDGQLGDEWGVEPQWFENNPTPLPTYENITIVAPCYTTSHLPYYRSAVSVCEIQTWPFSDDALTGLVQSFTALAWGGAFFHASWTALGGAADVVMNSLLALIVYRKCYYPHATKKNCVWQQPEAPLTTSPISMC